MQNIIQTPSTQYNHTFSKLFFQLGASIPQHKSHDLKESLGGLPVYFDNGLDGSIQELCQEHNKKFTELKIEYNTLLDRLISFYIKEKKNVTPDDEQVIKKINDFRLHLFDNGGSYFGDYRIILFGTAKEYLELIVRSLEQPTIPTEKTLDTIQRLADAIDTCAGGAISALQDAMVTQMNAEAGLAGYLATTKIKITNASIQNFCREKHSQLFNYANDERHYVNFYRKVLQDALGIMVPHDPSIRLAEDSIKNQMEEINYTLVMNQKEDQIVDFPKECLKYVQQCLTPFHLIDYIVSDYRQYVQELLNNYGKELPLSLKSENYKQFESNLALLEKAGTKDFGGPLERNYLKLDESYLNIIGLTSNTILMRLEILTRLQQAGFISIDKPKYLGEQNHQRILYIPGQNLIWMESFKGEQSLVPPDYLEKIDFQLLSPEDRRFVYKQLADDDVILGHYQYAQMCYKGLGGPVDLWTARAHYKHAADLGDKHAQYNYARMCQRGEGGEENLLEARTYYKRAADQDDIDAQYCYAKMCLKEEGGNKNLLDARTYYKRAADQEDSDAQYAYAQMCQKGQGGHRDLPEARTYYKHAADQDDRYAQHRYATMCRKGHGGEINLLEALAYYKKALEQGHPDAENSYEELKELLEAK